MKEGKKVSGGENILRGFNLTSVDSAIFAGLQSMYGRFDVMYLVERVDFLIDWGECNHSMLCPKVMVKFNGEIISVANSVGRLGYDAGTFTQCKIARASCEAHPCEAHPCETK